MAVEEEYVDGFPVSEMVGFVGKIGTAPEVVIFGGNIVGAASFGPVGRRIADEHGVSGYEFPVFAPAFRGEIKIITVLGRGYKIVIVGRVVCRKPVVELHHCIGHCIGADDLGCRTEDRLVPSKVAAVVPAFQLLFYSQVWKHLEDEQMTVVGFGILLRISNRIPAVI